MIPNLFRFGPAELSQDAFFCWLLAWADIGNAVTDPSCHRAGLAFLNALIAMYGEPSVEEATVKVQRQVQGVDIIVEIADRLVVLIEDKVQAGVHGDQLSRYLINTRHKYPDRRVMPLFVKTGDQSSYQKVEDAGYALFLRRQIIDTLRPYKDSVTNLIFREFLQNVERIDCEVESYAVKEVTAWVQEWSPWLGFYMRLQRDLDDGMEWAYVANPTGGFLGAWWHFRNWTDPVSGIIHDVYLQIEQGPLCFKIAVAENESDRAAVRQRWHERLMAVSRDMGVVVGRPARMGNGTYMTVGRIELAKWLVQRADGTLDTGAVLTNLHQAASIVDQAANADDIGMGTIDPH